MDNRLNEEQNKIEDEAMLRRKQRIAQMRREKEKRLRQQALLKRFLPLAAGAVMILLVVGGILITIGRSAGTSNAEEDVSQEMLAEGAGTSGANGVGGGDGGLVGSDFTADVSQGEETDGTTSEPQTQEPESTDPPYIATTSEATTAVSSEVVSTSAIFIDLDTDTILAERDAHTRISPASMTKILTVLVAAEHVTNLDDTFTITIDITDYSFVNDCSNVGFDVGETVTIRDLFYGTILPSGADAALGLAIYVAGSQEAFVELMNEKLEELGLSDTAHFTNCVGLYDAEHYCTVYDMAMILEAAVDNEFCREVLSAHTYTTSSTEQHPEGLLISNWFLRRIEDSDTYGEVLCGKTGYVLQSGSCAASYGLDTQGGDYICVTANSSSSWRCIYDHVALYQQFLPPVEIETEEGE